MIGFPDSTVSRVRVSCAHFSLVWFAVISRWWLCNVRDLVYNENSTQFSAEVVNKGFALTST